MCFEFHLAAAIELAALQRTRCPLVHQSPRGHSPAWAFVDLLNPGLVDRSLFPGVRPRKLLLPNSQTPKTRERQAIPCGVARSAKWRSSRALFALAVCKSVSSDRSRPVMLSSRVARPVACCGRARESALLMLSPAEGPHNQTPKPRSNATPLAPLWSEPERAGASGVADSTLTPTGAADSSEKALTPR